MRNLNDLGRRYIAQHLDMQLPPKLLDAIDPVPFGRYALKEKQGHFTEPGYISLSSDPWQHDRTLEQDHRETEKKTSIRDRLEQGKKECAGRQTLSPNTGKSEPEL
jgi:hypothetical protein